MVESKKPPQTKKMQRGKPRFKRAHVEDDVIAAAVIDYFAAGCSVSASPSQRNTALRFGMNKRTLANYIRCVHSALGERGIDVTKPIHVGHGTRATVSKGDILLIVQTRKHKQRGSLPLMNAENREKFFVHARLRSQCNFGMTVREMQIVVPEGGRRVGFGFKAHGGL